jgi:HK97 family phage portal protein
VKIQIGSFSLELRTKAAGGDLITHLPSSQGWWPIIREAFAGAWQRGVHVPVEDALTHPTFWACVTLIAGDIAKMRAMLVEETDDGINIEVNRQSPYAPVIIKPNHYQNRIQFYIYWIISKLTRGNTYALKARDARGIVTDAYLLDPTRVRPMVTPDGQVYYACQQDLLAELTDASIVIPAREIIHDIGFAPYHPLIGFSPVYACGHAAMQGLTIVGNMTRMFKHGSQVGGVLTAPGQISPETAARLEKYWEENYAGEANIGKIAVLGDGLKFEKPTVMSAVDAQLIDQLKWDDEKICAVFHVPPYMVGVGSMPAYNNIEALAQQYYSQCLQLLIESLELCLTEGLELEDVKRPDGGTGYEVEFDVASLLRMDSVAKMEAATKGVVGGIYTPNEARASFNLKPVKGGDTPYLQQQNFSLAALDARDKASAKAAANPPPPPPAPGDPPKPGDPKVDDPPPKPSDPPKVDDPPPLPPTKAIDIAAFTRELAASERAWAERYRAWESDDETAHLQATA